MKKTVIPASDFVAHRQFVQSAMDGFFGVRVRISDKMFQALELTDDVRGEGICSSGALLASGVRCLPALGEILLNSGIDTTSLALPRLHQLNIDTALSRADRDARAEFAVRLEPWFLLLDEEGLPPNRAFQRVCRTRRVCLVDAIQGCLESRYQDDRQGAKGEGTVSTNDLVAILTTHMQRGRRARMDESAINAVCGVLMQRLMLRQEVDPTLGSQQFAMLHDGRKYRIRPVAQWGYHVVDDMRQRDGALWLAESRVVQPPSRFSLEAIAELEGLINCGAKESTFQQFFERHQEFLVTLGNYCSVHPHLVLHEDGGESLIPDFFLERTGSRFCDICDIKLPTHRLVRLQRRRVRFTDVVQEALAQLAHYRRWFDDRQNRSRFRATYDLSSYKPRVIVIIGRESGFADASQRAGLESELMGQVSLKTYDDIVMQARQWNHLMFGYSGTG